MFAWAIVAYLQNLGAHGIDANPLNPPNLKTTTIVVVFNILEKLEEDMKQSSSYCKYLVLETYPMCWYKMIAGTVIGHSPAYLKVGDFRKNLNFFTKSLFYSDKFW